MGLFEKFRKEAPSRDELTARGASKEYADWLLSGPAPGEVFVDTSEPSAADARKLVAHFNESDWSLLRIAAQATIEAALGEGHLAEENPSAYEAHINTLQDDVNETLRSVGVDPYTLLPLEPAV